MADATHHTPDPCLEFVTAWRHGREQSAANRSDAFYEAHVKPLEDQAAFGTIPTATTMQGAVSALQMVLHIDEHDGAMSSLERQDANLIRAALGFLAADPRSHPFVQRMERYRDEVATYNADADACDSAGFNPDDRLGEDLQSGAARVTTDAEAAEAIRYVLAEDCIVDSLAEKMIRQTLAFLEGRA